VRIWPKEGIQSIQCTSPLPGHTCVRVCLQGGLQATRGMLFSSYDHSMRYLSGASE